MIDEIKGAGIYTGIKQSKKALAGGVVKKAFVAFDAADAVTAPFVEQCRAAGVEVNSDYSMHQLGEAAKIDIGASVIVLLKD